VGAADKVGVKLTLLGLRLGGDGISKEEGEVTSLINSWNDKFLGCSYFILVALLENNGQHYNRHQNLNS
jgi:hypothetical protein